MTPGFIVFAGGLALADSGVQLVDANGDGRTDLLVTKDGLTGYYPLRFGGLWDRRSFQRYRAVPSFSLRDPEVRLVDLDGDGRRDLAILAGENFDGVLKLTLLPQRCAP